MIVRCTASALRIRSLPIVAETTETERRLVRDQLATAYGRSFDEKWLFVKTETGYGWASAEYLVEAKVVAPPTAAPAKLKYTLEGEDPELTAKIEKLRVAALKEGIEFTTADFGGVRTEADTAKIMKYRDDDYAVYVKNLKRGTKPMPINDWRRIAPFGSSYHNYGAARDLKPTKWPQSFTSDRAMDRLRALALTVGLKTISKDPPHVQLPITLAQARARWKARQG